MRQIWELLSNYIIVAHLSRFFWYNSNNGKYNDHIHKGKTQD
jgi:hypothetical protein